MIDQLKYHRFLYNKNRIGNKIENNWSNSKKKATRVSPIDIQ